MDLDEMTRSTRMMRITAALADLAVQFDAAAAMPRSTDAEWVARSERLALVCAREAGWWRVLGKAVYADAPGPTVMGNAAIGSAVVGNAMVVAACKRRDDARFWRESAADWRARAEGRPTSDAAGALSNWHELGMTA